MVLATQYGLKDEYCLKHILLPEDVINNDKPRGILTVSLDFELYWGVRDKRTIAQYQTNLDGTEAAIKAILNSFDKYELHATWASVGFLFFNDSNELSNNLPELQPAYENTNLNPYSYIANNTLEKKYHFAPAIIEDISNHPHQEIATHTMSHYYCLEPNQTPEQFEIDLRLAIATIKEKIGTETRSLVFPRNQSNNDYLEALKSLNIASYRGNENSWLYDANNANGETLHKRAFRLLDSFINFSGHHTYKPEDIKKTSPLNLRSSRFLRPYSKKLKLLNRLKLNRIKKSMLHAAKNNEIYHLWWHPHNFGANTVQNINFLNQILEYYQHLNKRFDMQSLNMQELSKLVLEH